MGVAQLLHHFTFSAWEVQRLRRLSCFVETASNRVGCAAISTSLDSSMVTLRNAVFCVRDRTKFVDSLYFVKSGPAFCQEICLGISEQKKRALFGPAGRRKRLESSPRKSCLTSKKTKRRTFGVRYAYRFFLELGSCVFFRGGAAVWTKAEN